MDSPDVPSDSTHLKARVLPRLRAVQTELGLHGADMAEYVHATRNAYSNWVSEKRPEKPALESMVILCDKFGVTLDWLYRGRADSMPTRLAIRLEARLMGLDPDAATPGEMAPVLERFGASAYRSASDAASV